MKQIVISRKQFDVTNSFKDPLSLTKSFYFLVAGGVLQIGYPYGEVSFQPPSKIETFNATVRYKFECVLQW